MAWHRAISLGCSRRSPGSEQGARLGRIEIRGLMTVPPWTEDPELARPYFRQLRELRDQLQPRYPGLTELSMGMSNDFVVAIEEGSTCVRIGTAIFGRRTIPGQGYGGGVNAGN